MLGNSHGTRAGLGWLSLNLLLLAGCGGHGLEPDEPPRAPSAAFEARNAPAAVVEQSRADSLSIQEIARLAKGSLVVVNTADGFGTGFSLGEGGSVVTNYHVVQGADRIGVEDLEGRFYLVTAVRAFDEEDDLAILEVPTLRLPGLALATDVPEPGESVVVLGHPKGLTATVSDGLVAAIRELSPGMVRLQFTAPIATGSS